MRLLLDFTYRNFHKGTCQPEVLKRTFYTSVKLQFFKGYISLIESSNKIDIFLEKYNKKGRETENIKQYDTNKRNKNIMLP